MSFTCPKPEGVMKGVMFYACILFEGTKDCRDDRNDGER